MGSGNGDRIIVDEGDDSGYLAQQQEGFNYNDFLNRLMGTKYIKYDWRNLIVVL